MNHPGAALTVYVCESGYFHYGHVPWGVARGVIPRDKIKNTRKAS